MIRPRYPQKQFPFCCQTIRENAFFVNSYRLGGCKRIRHKGAQKTQGRKVQKLKSCGLAIFLKQIFDDLLLPLIDPTGNRDDEKRKWIQIRSHSDRLPPAKTSYLNSKPGSIEFFYTTP